jgi:hypothetical protein
MPSLPVAVGAGNVDALLIGNRVHGNNLGNAGNLIASIYVEAARGDARKGSGQFSKGGFGGRGHEFRGNRQGL